MKYPNSSWSCANCKTRFKYIEQLPKQTLKACVWYGHRGIPPFTRPYNDSPLINLFNYCETCI